MQFLFDLLGLRAFHLDCLAVLLNSITIKTDELGILTLLLMDVTLAEVTFELNNGFHAGLNESIFTLFFDISDSYSFVLSSMRRDF